MSSRILAPFAAVLCAALAGCGGGWGTTSGTVTLDGTPLKEGAIAFHPSGDGPTSYGTVTDGAFTISTGQKDGLPAGKYRVTVSASTIPKEGTNEQSKLLTPAKYSKADSTDLEADVKSGSNSFKFEMKSK